MHNNHKVTTASTASTIYEGKKTCLKYVSDNICGIIHMFIETDT